MGIRRRWQSALPLIRHIRGEQSPSATASTRIPWIAISTTVIPTATAGVSGVTLSASGAAARDPRVAIRVESGKARRRVVELVGCAVFLILAAIGVYIFLNQGR